VETSSRSAEAASETRSSRESDRRAASRPAAPSSRTAAAAARPTATQRPVRTPQQAHPARIWVQLAAAGRTDLPGELSRLRRMAPEVLRGRTGYTAPLGTSNNRLLVGPFATSAEARTFINKLKEEEISSYAWSSAAGQEVQRLPAGR